MACKGIRGHKWKAVHKGYHKGSLKIKLMRCKKCGASQRKTY